MIGCDFDFLHVGVNGQFSFILMNDAFLSLSRFSKLKYFFLIIFSDL